MEGSQKGEGDKDNIWHQVLREASKKTRLLDEKSVLVLGERSGGKSSVLARLQGLDISEAAVDGVALHYTYLDIFGSDENDDLLSRAHIWTLEGDVGHAPLLDFALNDKNIENSMVLLVLDFSQPWSLVESLEKWLKVLANHIEVLKTKLSPGEFEALQKTNIIKFQQYKEPSGLKPSASVSATISLPTQSVSEVEEEVVLPCGEGVLTKNLGVPIVVVCNKADAVAMLEKEYSYKDDIFVYIQQYLRRICLSYGAGLIYVSAKRDTNCDVLHKYLMHRLYGLDFSTPAQLLEKYLIFVPSGWDSKAKIDIDFANQKFCTDQDLPFEEVVRRPQHSSLQQTKTIYDVDVVAEDDQEFLGRVMKNIEKADSQKSPSAFTAETEPTPEEVPHTPVASEKKPATTPARRNPTQLPAQLVAQAASALTPLGSKTGSLSDRSPRTPMKATGGGSGTPATPGGNSQNEHKVLADFFNSLINKDPRKAAPAKRTAPLSSSANNLTTHSPSSPSAGSPNGSAPSPSRVEAEKSMNRLKGEQS